MQNIFCRIFTVAMVLVILNGCSGNIEKEIIGSWRGNTTDFIFNSDHTFEQKDSHPKRVSKGTYELFDGNKVRLNYNKLKFDVIHTARISGDNLKLTNGDGKSARFKRVSTSP